MQYTPLILLLDLCPQRIVLIIIPDINCFAWILSISSDSKESFFIVLDNFHINLRFWNGVRVEYLSDAAISLKTYCFRQYFQSVHALIFDKLWITTIISQDLLLTSQQVYAVIAEIHNPWANDYRVFEMEIIFNFCPRFCFCFERIHIIDI